MDLGFVCGQEHDVNPAPLICLCGNPSCRALLALPFNYARATPNNATVSARWIRHGNHGARNEIAHGVDFQISHHQIWHKQNCSTSCLATNHLTYHCLISFILCLTGNSWVLSLIATLGGGRMLNAYSIRQVDTFESGPFITFTLQ